MATDTTCIPATGNSLINTDRFSDLIFFAGDFVYWSPSPISEIRREVFNNVPFLHPRQDQTNDSMAVQGTAYALLAYLHSNRYHDAIPIMKWLQTMRNKDGGFSSTQVAYRRSETRRRSNL